MRVGAAIGSDEPFYLNLRKGARAAVVVPLVLAFCELLLDNSGLALFAVFATTAALVFADYGGPPGPRARAYMTMLLLGAAMVLLGAGLSRNPVAAVAGMFAVAFGVTLASSLGGYAPLHVSPVALAYSLSALEPLSEVSVLDRLAGWSIGSFAAMLGALVLWPIVARTGLRDAAASLCNSLASTIADPTRDADRTVERLTEQAGELQRSASTRLRPSGAAAHDIALFHVIVHLQQATELTIRSVESALLAQCDASNGRESSDGDDASQAADDAELRRCIAAAMRRAAAVIARIAPADEHAGEPVDLANALASGRERVRDTVETCEPARAMSVMRDTVPIRALAHLAIWIEVEAAGAVGNRHLPAAADGTPDHAVLAIAPEVATSVPPDDAGNRLRRTRRLLQGELGYRSVVLRNSVRAGAALSTAVLLAEVLGVDHGFWVVLATLLVLRSDAYSTSANAMAAVLGTIGGFAVSVGIIELAADHQVVLWALFTLAVFLAGYSPGIFGTAIGQGAFAVMVVMLLTITSAPGLPTAVVRLETVALGAATAAILSLVIWPRGARALVAEVVAEAFRAASRATAVFVTCPPDASSDAQRQLSSARRKAEDALDAAMTEHGGQVTLVTWMPMLRVMETARALTLGLVPALHIDDSRGPCADSARLVKANADLLGARFSRIADALDSADPSMLSTPVAQNSTTVTRLEGSTPGSGEGLLDCLELRRSQAAAQNLQHPPAEEDPIYDAVILAGWSWFIEEMERGLDDTTPQVLEAVSTARPHTWLTGVRS